ncbi:MAG: glucosyl-3-phosphoglycerate synthase [Candidatus Bathyarchaeota archaeon]|nr:glucosyl-3-phosphoglycerate synthase [Candidatus Bathyarchaeota archaeon]
MDVDQGRITRIHDFDIKADVLKSRLKNLSHKYPSGVIIPVIGSDLTNPTFKEIVEGLNGCDYLKKVFIALSASPQEYRLAHQILSRFDLPYELLWCNNPDVATVLEELKSKGLDVTASRGKGKDVWMAIGIASLDLHAIAIHDADIVSYTELIPTKLLYSVVEPQLDFSFCKGYYARVNLERRRMYGRIYRLFINPLLEALQKKTGHKSTFIRYLQSFRYPLAGEVAIYSDLALNLRIPGDWGFEIGMLAELYRNVSAKRICEVDMGFFDHKHKAMNQDELLKTAGNSLITIFRTLTETDGINVSLPFLLSLQVIYRRFAQDRVRQYAADALCNDLIFDRHSEESSVEALSRVIMEGGQQYLNKPTSAQLPDWLRTLSVMPDARERLRSAAVET